MNPRTRSATARAQPARSPAALPEAASRADGPQGSPRQLRQAQALARLRHGGAAPVQRVAGGRYLTTEDCHLRDEAHEVIATLPAGTEVRVAPGARTQRFTRGLIFGRKDHTWATAQGRSGWIRDDALGLAPQEEPEPLPKEKERGSPSKSQPIGMPIPSSSGGKGLRTPRVDPGSLKDWKEGHRVKPIAVSKAKVQAFLQLKVYLHLTKDEYRPAIHHEGLKAGAGDGIGLPTDMGTKGKKESDPEYLYVLSGSVPETTHHVSSEAGQGQVAVISRHGTHDRDVNYKGGAYRFGSTIGPGRNYPPSQGAATISVVLPPSQSAKAGLAAFINDGAPNLTEPVTPAEAEVLLGAWLARHFTLHFPAYRDLLGVLPEDK